MKEHKWSEYRFYSDGELNGFRCCVQEYQCKSCKTIIEMPAGMSPRDYPYDPCKGLVIPPKVKYRHPIKGVKS